MTNVPSPLLLSLALALLGCGEPASYLADGGRPRQICTWEHTRLPVRVTDASGAGVPAASVAATHLGTGQTRTVTTDNDGRTRDLDDAWGPGSVRLQASLDGRVSPVQQVEWLCGDCNCMVWPGSVLLTLP